MRSLVLAAVLAAAVAPLARAAELPAELAGYEAEGEKWFNEAGKTDTPEGQRNEARKKALINLKKARDILDAHWDAHPEDQARIEDRLMKVGQMLFWAKKESPISVLEEAGLAPKRAAPIQPPAPPPSNPPGGTPPAPPAPGNPFDRPGAKPGGEAPPPAAAAGPTLEKLFADAEAWAKKHKGDTSGVMEHYQAVLAAFPEATTNPLYQKAAERAGQANAALKDVYRKMRDADPNSLKNVDSDELNKAVLFLGRDLGSQDSAVRERAAKLLGTLGSGEAVFPLVKALKKETEEQTLRALGDAVVAIGGAKAADQLGNLRDDKDLGGRSLDLLQRLTARNPVDRRFAIEEIGAYALAKDDAVAGRAVDFLVGLGPEGANGLVKALDTTRVEIRLKVIPALGATKNPKVARPLSAFLLMGDNPNTVRCRDAAIAAIKGLGEAAVPYLFHGLRGAATKQYTGFVLREMTGQMLSSSRPGDWVNWWKSTHPDWKDEGG